MKLCPNCQAQLPDEATLCGVCGAQQATAPAAAPAPVATPVASTVAPPIPPYMPAAKKPISIGGWIGRSLIPYIPIVGSIVYLVMLFIWMGDESKEDTFRNWAKAQLIVMLIGVGLVVLLVMLIIALGGLFAVGEEFLY